MALEVMKSIFAVLDVSFTSRIEQLIFRSDFLAVVSYDVLMHGGRLIHKVK